MSFLLADTERREDIVENILHCGLSGQGIQRFEGRVKIQQNYLMRHLVYERILALFKCQKSALNQLLLSEVSDQVPLSFMPAILLEQGTPKIVNTLPSLGRDAAYQLRSERKTLFIQLLRQVDLV